MKKIINPYTLMDTFTFDKNGRVIREKNKSVINLLINNDDVKKPENL